MRRNASKMFIVSNGELYRVVGDTAELTINDVTRSDGGFFTDCVRRATAAEAEAVSRAAEARRG